jgi:hypothetical protein
MFMIKDKNMLEEKFLPHYFESHKCASFARQLNIYGFEKVYSRDLLLASGVHDLENSSHIVVYQHTSFQRGKQEALKHVVPSRRKKRNQQSAAASARKEADRTAEADAVDDDKPGSEIQIMRNDLNSIVERVSSLEENAADDDKPESELQIMRNDLNSIVERVSSLEELLLHTTEVFVSQMKELRQSAARQSAAYYRPGLAGNSLPQGSVFPQYTSNYTPFQDGSLTQDRFCQLQYDTQQQSMPPPTANHCPIRLMNILMPCNTSLSASMLESPGNNVNDHEEDDGVVCDVISSFSGPDPLSVSEPTTDDYATGKEACEE